MLRKASVLMSLEYSSPFRSLSRGPSGCRLIVLSSERYSQVTATLVATFLALLEGWKKKYAFKSSPLCVLFLFRASTTSVNPLHNTKRCRYTLRSPARFYAQNTTFAQWFTPLLPQWGRFSASRRALFGISKGAFMPQWVYYTCLQVSCQNTL